MGPRLRPIDLDTLPNDSIARRKVLEKRAEPRTTAEMLAAVDPDMEADYARQDELSAQCYIKNEETCYRMRQLAKRVGSTVPR